MSFVYRSPLSTGQKIILEIQCPYVLLSKNLHEKTYQLGETPGQ